MQRILVMVPAYNEAEYIGPVIRSLVRAKKFLPNMDFVVLDNMSHDGTAKIAEQKGALGKIIQVQTPGKGSVFTKGVEWAFGVAKKEGLNPRDVALVTIDADLRAFSPRQIMELVKPLEKAHVDMSIAKFYEPQEKGGRDNFAMVSEYSGERAIRLSATKPILAGNKSWKYLLRQGFGLEEVLNKKIKKFYLAPAEFVAMRPAFGVETGYLVSSRVNAYLKQTGEIRRVNKYLEARTRGAALIRARRAKATQSREFRLLNLTK